MLAIPALGAVALFVYPAYQGALRGADRAKLENDLKVIHQDFNLIASDNLTHNGMPLKWPAEMGVSSRNEFVEAFLSDEVKKQIAEIYGTEFDRLVAKAQTQADKEDLLLIKKGGIQSLPSATLASIQFTNFSKTDTDNTIVAFKEPSTSDPVGGVLLKDGQCITYWQRKGEKATDYGVMPDRTPAVLP